MPIRSSKGTNQLAFSIVQQVTDEAAAQPEKNPAERMGGLKGGKARAAALTPAKRKAIAKKAAAARWA